MLSQNFSVTCDNTTTHCKFHFQQLWVSSEPIPACIGVPLGSSATTYLPNAYKRLGDLESQSKQNKVKTVGRYLLGDCAISTVSMLGWPNVIVQPLASRAAPCTTTLSHVWFFLASIASKLQLLPAFPSLPPVPIYLQKNPQSSCFSLPETCFCWKWECGCFRQ